jgi:hypothetical protein
VKERSYIIVAVLAVLTAAGCVWSNFLRVPIVFSISFVQYDAWMSFTGFILLSLCVAVVLTGSAGLTGLLLSTGFHCPNLWIARIGVGRRFLVPAASGLVFGIVLLNIAIQAAYLRPLDYDSAGSLALFGLSLAFSALFLQILHTLFLVPLIGQALHTFILFRRPKRDAYWLGALLVAIALPAVFLQSYGNPTALAYLRGLLGAGILISAHFMKSAGFLASLGFALAACAGILLGLALP